MPRLDLLPCRLPRGPWIETRARRHVIVFDEIDAFTRERGSLRGDTSGIRDSVVNQLLAKMDGVEQ